LIVRGQGNASSLSLDEVRSQVALTALLGGLTLDSDDLTGMRPGRLKYLRQALPPTGVSARPLDLFDHELARTLVLPVEREWGRWWVAAVVNWEDKMTELTLRLSDLGLPPDRYHVYHYWRQRYLGLAQDEITLPRHLARAHETLVLLFKPVSERPDLLTTTFHVCQGAVEVKKMERRLDIGDSSPRSGAERDGERESLRVVLEKAGRQFGKVLFTLPEGWQATDARVDGRQRRFTTVADGVVGLGLTLSGSATIEADFVKT